MSALTKILIVLQLVFALVCSVLLVLLVSKQQNYMKAADDANARALAMSATQVDTVKQLQAANAQASESTKTQTNLNNQLTQANADKIALQAKLESDILNLRSQLATESAKVASLSAANNTLTATNGALNSELGDIRPKVAKLTTDNSELTRAVNETTNQLRAAEQAIRKLQEQQVAGAAPAGAVAPMGSESQVKMMTSAPVSGRINAKVSQVGQSQGRAVIGLPLGTRDGIQKDIKLFIYRGSDYVGEATVTMVTPDESLAQVTSTKKGETVQQGDLVSTVSK